MRKIFLLLFSFILILTGCSSDKTTVEYYLNNHYYDLGSTGLGHYYDVDGVAQYDEDFSALKKDVDEGQVMHLFYDNGEIFGFEATYALDDIQVRLGYDMDNENYYCYAQNTVTEVREDNIGCSNTYVYIQENAPDLAKEFSTISESFEISMDSLIVGESQQVEDVVNNLK